MFHQEEKDGQEVKLSAFIQNTMSGFAWHLVSKKCQNYDSYKYSSKIRKKDGVIRVGQHDPNQSTVLYSVFVIDSHRDLPQLPDLVDPYTKISFRKFTIYFIVRYLAIPSLNKGSYIISPTSSAQINGSSVTKQFYIESVPFGLLAFEAHQFFIQLRESALRHVSLIVCEPEAEFARGETAFFHATAPEMGMDSHGKRVCWSCPMFPTDNHEGYPLKFFFHDLVRKGHSCDYVK